MKKVFIACFFAIIMALVPITTVAHTPDVENISPTTLEKPQIFITIDQLRELNNYIKDNFEGDAYYQAITIRNKIITNLEVDLYELGLAWEEYGFQPIPEDELYEAQGVNGILDLIDEYWFANLFGGLLNKIFELIKDRLGWIYTFFNDGSSLFFRGIDLTLKTLNMGKELLIAFILIINNLLTIPGLIAEAIQYLFSIDFGNFLNTIAEILSIFGDAFILALELAKDVFHLYQDIVDYIDDFQTYVEWLQANPWTFPILVKGSVKNFIFKQPVIGATVSCKGQSTMTDETGNFEFQVDPAPDGDSFPPNEYYGMHCCQITVEKNGKVLKQTPPLLSYSFSAGTIEWSFIVLGGKSAAASSSSSASSSSTSSSASSSSSSSSTSSQSSQQQSIPLSNPFGGLSNNN